MSAVSIPDEADKR